MAATVTKPVTDDTLIEEIVASKKNVTILNTNGVLTVGDAKKKSIKEMAEWGVGEVSLNEITAACNPPKMPVKSDEVEEGPNPIHIRSPYQGFSLQILPGDAIRNESGRGVRPVKPIYLVCYRGEGKLTADMWFTRKYKRDRVAVDKAIQGGEPWRKEAVEWLRARKAHQSKDFVILTD